ncbi:hypothetical protein IAU59_007465 [Kwoniella sp. CBS 9459]
MDNLDLPSANGWFVCLQPVLPSSPVIDFTLAELYVKEAPKDSKLLVAGGGVIGRKSKSSTSSRQGRGEIDSPIISRTHTQLVITPNGHLYVIDLGSMHGTNIVPYMDPNNPGSLSSSFPIKCSHHSPIQLLEGDTLVFGKRVISSEVPYDPIRYRIRFRYPMLGLGSRSKGDRKELGKISGEKALERFASAKYQERLLRILQDKGGAVGILSVHDANSGADTPEIITPPPPQHSTDSARLYDPSRDIIDLTTSQSSRENAIIAKAKTNTYGVPPSVLYDSADDSHASGHSDGDQEESEDSFTDNEDEDDDGPPEIMGVRSPIDVPPFALSGTSHMFDSQTPCKTPTPSDPVRSEVSAPKSPGSCDVARPPQASLTHYFSLFLEQSSSPEPRSPRPADMEPVSSGLGNWFSYSSDAEEDHGHDEVESCEDDFPNITYPHELCAPALHDTTYVMAGRAASSEPPYTDVESGPHHSLSSSLSSFAESDEGEGVALDRKSDNGTSSVLIAKEPQAAKSHSRTQTPSGPALQAGTDTGLEQDPQERTHTSSLMNKPSSATQVDVKAVEVLKIASEHEQDLDSADSVSSRDSYTKSIHDEHQSEDDDRSDYSSDHYSHEYEDSEADSHAHLSSNGHYSSDGEDHDDSSDNDDGRSALYSNCDDEVEEFSDEHVEEVDASDYNEDSDAADYSADEHHAEGSHYGEEEEDRAEDEDVDEEDDMDEASDMNEESDMNEDSDMDEDEDMDEDSDANEESDVNEDEEVDGDEYEDEEPAAPLVKPTVRDATPKIKVEPIASAVVVPPTSTSDSAPLESAQETVKQGELNQASIREFCEVKAAKTQTDGPDREDAQSLPHMAIKQEKVATEPPAPTSDGQEATAPDTVQNQPSMDDSTSIADKEREPELVASEPSSEPAPVVVQTGDGSGEEQHARVEWEQLDDSELILGDSSIIHSRVPACDSTSSGSDSEGPVTPTWSKKRSLPDDFTVADPEVVKPLIASPSSSPAAASPSSAKAGEANVRPLKRARRIGSAFGLIAIGAALGSASTIVGLMQLGERQ